MDDVLNMIALAGAAGVMFGGGWAYVSIEEALGRRRPRAKAPALEPRILFRVGGGPPATAPAMPTTLEECLSGQPYVI